VFFTDSFYLEEPDGDNAEIASETITKTTWIGAPDTLTPDAINTARYPGYELDYTDRAD
jgi:hypothetical protein